MRHCVAVLLSGGTGTRLGAEIPKQYIRTGGRMMITRSLHALFLCPEIEAVQIVADAAWRSLIEEDWKASVSVTRGTEWICGFSNPGDTPHRAHTTISADRRMRLSPHGRWPCRRS